MAEENIQKGGLAALLRIMPSFAGFGTQFRTGMKGQAPLVVQFARTMGGQFSAAFVAGLGIRAMTRNFQEVIAAAMSFEDSFTGVRKTVDATEEEFQILAQGMRDLSKELPIAVEEINRIGEVAGQLGISKAGLVDFTETVAKLAATTTMSSESAAFSLARLASIAKLPESAFKMIGGVIVELGNNFATTEGMMTNLAMRIVGTGRVVGMSVPDIFALSAAISQVGVRAELGGTAMSRFLVAVSMAARTGGAELNTIARVAGMSANQFKDAFEDDAAMAVAAFLKGLNQMKEDGEDVFAIMEKLGLNAVRVRDVLLRSSQAAPEFFKAIDLARAQEDLSDAENALEVEFQKRVETATSRVVLMNNAINDLRISLGEAFLPAVKNVADVIGGLTNAYNEGSTAVKLFVFLTKNLLLTVTAVTVGLLSYKAAFAALSLVIKSTDIAVKGLTLSIGALAKGVSAFLGFFTLIIAALANAEAKTALFIQRIADLRNAVEASPQEKLNIITELLGDDADEVLLQISKTEVGINDLFGAIQNGVNSGDAFKLKEQLAEVINELDPANKVFLNGVSSLEDFNRAMNQLTFDSFDPEARGRKQMVDVLLDVLGDIEDKEPEIKARQDALKLLSADTGNKVSEGLEEGGGAIKNALDFFNDNLRDGLTDSFNILEEADTRINTSLDDIIANMVVKAGELEEFELGLEALAKRNLAGLVKFLEEEGPKVNGLIKEILDAPEEVGIFMEMMLAQLNPQFFKKNFDSELPPLFSDVEKMFAENGAQIGKTFGSNVNQNIAELFGETELGTEAFPVMFAKKMLDDSNVNMTMTDYMNFLDKVVINPTIRGKIDELSERIANDLTGGLQDELRDFGGIVDIVTGKISKARAKTRFNDAEEEYNSLLEEQGTILEDIVEQTELVNQLRDESAARTAAEQLEIRDLTKKRDFLTKAVEEGQDATLELAVAEEELAEAIKRADEPTRELTEAEEELARLQERQIELPGLIESARISLDETTLRLVESEDGLADALQKTNELTEKQIGNFIALATSAGIADTFVRNLLSTYGITPTSLPEVETVVPPSTNNETIVRPDIPMFAKGGFLPTGGVGIVGERGMEMIRATSSGVQVSPLEDAGTTQNITVNVTGFPTDPIVARNIAQRIKDELITLEDEGSGGLLAR